LISAYAIQSHTAFIYIRGEMVFGAIRLERAVEEAYRAGFIGKNIFGSGYDLDLIVIVARAPISAVKRPRCCRHWKAAAAGPN